MENKLHSLWRKYKSLFIFCFIVTFVIGMTAHGFQFLNFRPSHDSMDGLYLRGRENYHKIELGRIFSPVYRAIFRGQFSAPWIIGVLSLLWISLAVFFTVECLNIKSKLIITLISGVMTVNITVTALAATYIHDLDANMFGMMLACLAVFLWKNRVPGWLVTGSLALCISLGIYQSYISVAVMLIAYILLLNILDGAKSVDVIKDSVNVATMGILGSILYLISLKIIPGLLSIPLAERENSVSSLKNLTFSDIPVNIINAYVKWWDYFRNPRTSWTSERIVFLLNIIVMALIVIMTIFIVIKNKLQAVSVLMAAAILVLSPLAMNLIYVLSPYEYHDLMKYSFIFLFIMALMLAEKCGIRLAKLTVCLSVALLLNSEIQTANDAYLKKEMTYQATYARMTFVLNDMMDFGFRPGDSYVYIANETPVNAYGEFGSINDIRGMLYNNSVTSDDKSIDYYFDFILGFPVDFCTDEQQQAIAESETFKNMPAYPENGYIAYIDDILVVKLSY